ncbi:MAG: aminotransferase class III-fold pyridoxal phosphate-dependent enzyme [Planctomycetota bacterium]|jgi:adenosylmethionine-8-amino-7-oxononanoate aminotransferase
MSNKKTMRDISGHVFPRRLDKPLPVIDSAQGMWMVDTEGRRYLDASGGAVVLNVGHGREEIARAVYDQIVQCDYVHPTMFTNYPVEELATALAGHAPPGIELNPFPRRDKVAERLWQTLFQKGVLIYNSTGLAGIDGDALLIGPPFIIEENDMDAVVDAIDQAMADVLG